MSEIKNNNDVVEIILGGSAYLSLKSSCFKDNNIIDFPISFSAGDLLEINNYVIRLPKNIYLEEIICDYKDKIIELYDLVDKGYKVRVWTSHYDPDDYLLLLFICSYLKDKVDNIIVLYSDEYKDECYSPSTMTGEELEKLSTHEHILSKEDINKLLKEWNKIVEENSDLRIIKNNKVESISYDYFDDEILEFLSSKKTSTILELCYEFSNKYYINDALFIYLVTRLINAGKIVVVEQNERFIKNIIKGVDPNE